MWWILWSVVCSVLWSGKGSKETAWLAAEVVGRRADPPTIDNGFEWLESGGTGNGGPRMKDVLHTITILFCPFSQFILPLVV